MLKKERRGREGERERGGGGVISRFIYAI